jgi:hypothetical protein
MIQALTVKETTSKAHMQVHTNTRIPITREATGEKTGPNWTEMGLGWPAWADRPRTLWVGFDAPFSRGVCLFIASASVGRHIDPIILPPPITRKPPPQDEGVSWVSSLKGSTPAKGRKQEENSKPLA